MSSPLVGTWEPVSEDPREGFWIFTETHYSVVFAPKDRPDIEGRDPTSDEIAKTYRSVDALAGPYTVSGSTFTLHRTAQLRLGLVGLDVEAEFTIEGDLLTLRSTSGTRRPREDVLRKVG